jgi:hypothetical protein
MGLLFSLVPLQKKCIKQHLEEKALAAMAYKCKKDEQTQIFRILELLNVKTNS